MTKFTCLSSRIVFAVWVLCPIYSFAAEPSTDEPAKSDKSALRSRVLEEVVVTATKREADLRDVPLSIDAFSGEALREIGVENVEGIARFSPGVSVSPGLDPEAAQIIIRVSPPTRFSRFLPEPSGCFTKIYHLLIRQYWARSQI